MRELALAQIAVNDGTDAKIFRRLGADDPTDPNAYTFFGDYLEPHKSLPNSYENPIDGMVRLLREQTSLYMEHGEDLLLGHYRPLQVPEGYSQDDSPVKVHFFEAFIRKKVDAEQLYIPEVNLELAFKGVNHAILTTKNLLKQQEVVPLARFILEQMAIDRNSRLMRGEAI